MERKDIRMEEKKSFFYFLPLWSKSTEDLLECLIDPGRPLFQGVSHALLTCPIILIPVLS